ncbi:tyrosine-type recombinase/integrase [Agromyces sp. NPDC057865]|uniref:tyrosine-type recombinase/integrase n=1 Tax=Agromyces sp. NPDC057865 TaxID=3346267 RepID=UPI00366BEF60
MANYRQLPSGNVQARFSYEGRKYTLTAPTKRQAQIAVAKQLADLDRGTFKEDSAGKQLFEDWAEEVMQARASRLAPGTMVNYRTWLKKHINPTFGSMQLRHIRKIDVDQWFSKMDKTTLRKNCHMVLSMVLREAVDNELIQTNPASRVKDARKDVSPKRPTFTKAEFDRIYEEATPDFKALLTLLFWSGMRIGEALGLDRRHVDFTTGWIDIEQHFANAPGGWKMFPGTKHSDTGRRVHLPTDRLGPVWAYVDRHPALSSDPFFTGKLGHRLSKRAVDTQWSECRERAGLPTFRIHDIRHLHLTLYAQRASLKEVMDRAGQRDYRSVLRYLHSDEQRQMALTQSLSEMMS